MLDIEIIYVGAAEAHLRESLSLYTERIKPYARLRETEIKAESFGDSSRERAMRLEWEKINQHLQKRDGAEVFYLSESGRHFDSISFAKRLEQVPGRIIFVLAGPLGWAAEADLSARNTLSLSSLTMTHGLARLVLSEQIYRALSIMKGKNYHY